MRSNVRASRCTRGALAVALIWILTSCGGSGGSPVRVTIPSGAGLRVISDSLARTGVIRSSGLFRVYASLRGGDRQIKAGTYLLHRGSGWNTVLDALRAGKGIVHVVTIPEGFSLAQIRPVVDHTDASTARFDP